jgi:hypothetical protein
MKVTTYRYPVRKCRMYGASLCTSVCSHSIVFTFTDLMDYVCNTQQRSCNSFSMSFSFLLPIGLYVKYAYGDIVLKQTGSVKL